MNTENWIATVAAAISFCSFIASLYQARKSHKSQEESANSASRSATAAEAATEAQHRIAKALEKIGSKYPMPWKIEHFRGQAFLLTNDSDEPVHNVELEIASIIGNEDLTRKVMNPGDSMKFFYAPDGSERSAVVRWTRPSENHPRVWNGHVPPKTTTQ